MARAEEQKSKMQYTSFSSESSYSMEIPFNLFIPSIFFFLLVCSYAASVGSKVSKPNSLLIPIRKDTKSLQYYATLQLGNPVSYIKATIDLCGSLVAVICDKYNSTSKHQVDCKSKKCKDAQGSCQLENRCDVTAINPFKRNYIGGPMEDEKIKVGTTDGVRYLSEHEVDHFAVSCAESYGFKGLAAGFSGIVGLGNRPAALQKQLASLFKVPQKFALCLPSSNEIGLGDLFIGGGPFHMLPYAKDLSTQLVQTPLVTNPISTDPITSAENLHMSISLESLLAIIKDGVGGTKLSTTAHFTTLHTSIYKAIATKFVKKFTSINIKVASVYPFGDCFSSKNIGKSTTGLAVPVIDLVLQNDVSWRIYGHNSMKQVSKEVVCLAFVDGGSGQMVELVDWGWEVMASIVLDGHQLEDKLIEFDLVSSKFRFINSLYLHNTSCSHFRLL